MSDFKVEVDKRFDKLEAQIDKADARIASLRTEINTRFDNAYAGVAQALQETYSPKSKIENIQAALPEPR